MRTQPLQRFLEAFLRDTAGEGGGAPAPAAPGTPAPAAAPAAAAPAADGVPAAAAVGQALDKGGGPSAFRPEGLPDHLYGKTDQETVDKLYGAYKGARDHIAKWGDVPKEPKDYAFEWSEPVKPYMGDADVPLLEEVKKIAHANGLGGKQLNGFINQTLAHMVSAELVAPAFSAEAERALIAPDVTDPKERAKVADQRIQENIALIDAWKKQDGGLPEEAAAFLDAQMDRAGAYKLVRWIADQRGEEIKPALGGAPGGGGLTKAQVDARWADPRQNTDSPKFDPAFAAETDRLYKQLASDQS